MDPWAGAAGRVRREGACEPTTAGGGATSREAN